MLENGFYDEYREGPSQPPLEHRRGKWHHVRLYGRSGYLTASDLPGVLRRHAAEQFREPNPANYTSSNYRNSSWYNTWPCTNSRT